MQLTITGYSTALFSTWYFIEELGILFDAGDGVSSGLLQKSRKIEHVLISHADRDHLTGLLQLNQLNARPGYPVIYYPQNSGSFPPLEAFSKKFDPHVNGTQWIPTKEGVEIRIREDIVAIPIQNGHVVTQGKGIKSLSYHIVQTKRKLKPELAKLSGMEIKRIVEEQGKVNTTVEVRTNLISYSGDTPVEDPQRWKDTKILIHEATFLDGEEDAKIRPHSNKHSTLEEVMEMIGSSTIETLILGHFSSRYSAEQIDLRIKQLCEKYAITIPVFRVLPGEISRNILNGVPVNQ
ncbi:MBL fold metallo-hydrolase [Xanthocytophaga flava]|uniref:MBL fold metallo-hydrolase n=1 Tax=Xanthocytophaga flava TaxID=3048013 RepID=UPI0028D850B4|nr:MBL fold metallo-hydrolase [Xanthocytophaga flavus]MDJ1469503.1 MBL fold metallo-hydrolase [Xanthocytophaga flavus]